METYDKYVDDAVSIEIGFTTMAGGHAHQMRAKRKGEAYELRNNDLLADSLGLYAAAAAQVAWGLVQRRFSETAERMMAEVHHSRPISSHPNPIPSYCMPSSPLRPCPAPFHLT